MLELLTEDNMILLIRSYQEHNPDMAAHLSAEVAAIHRMRARVSIRCERCTWAWHPVGEFPWRCERCWAVAVKL